MKETNAFISHLAFLCFGFILCFVFLLVWKVMSFFIWGFEVQSMASFPYYHDARLYTRPGIGDQTFTLQVDGETVWVSGDAAPGDLKEKLMWDEMGRKVTLEFLGKKVVTYDTKSKIAVTEY